MPWKETDVMKERVKFVLEWEKRWDEGEGQLNFAESILRPDAMLETSFRAATAGDYDVVVADANGSAQPAGFFYALQVWKNQ